MALMKVDRRGRATLPEEVRRDLDLDGGGEGLVILGRTERGTYELIPAALVPRDQLWFHSGEIQVRVREAEADFREGRVVLAETPEEAQAFLDGLKRA